MYIKRAIERNVELLFVGDSKYVAIIQIFIAVSFIVVNIL